MSINASDIQADFLSAFAREEKVVWVFLVNGIKLTGQLLAFDQYVLALQCPTGIQTVFKSAVSTVCEAHVVEHRRTRDRSAMSRERPPARGDHR
ncbi:RNA chaperone Hfq [Caballeronia sp. Lep1P3]|uniref:RNA chaperone Hfq n=1 Tax=Caballeronia sp. Lep1P3 TaxID=2878150 RepID=UPI001FD0173A|nr:RNA chaperone Hfq [Caballeronia sp. Lep1P3]